MAAAAAAGRRRVSARLQSDSCGGGAAAGGGVGPQPRRPRGRRGGAHLCLVDGRPVEREHRRSERKAARRLRAAAGLDGERAAAGHRRATSADTKSSEGERATVGRGSRTGWGGRGETRAKDSVARASRGRSLAAPTVPRARSAGARPGVESIGSNSVRIPAAPPEARGKRREARGGGRREEVRGERRGAGGGERRGADEGEGGRVGGLRPLLLGPWVGPRCEARRGADRPTHPSHAPVDWRHGRGKSSTGPAGQPRTNQRPRVSAGVEWQTDRARAG